MDMAPLPVPKSNILRVLASLDANFDRASRALSTSISVSALGMSTLGSTLSFKDQNSVSPIIYCKGSLVALLWINFLLIPQLKFSATEVKYKSEYHPQITWNSVRLRSRAFNHLGFNLPQFVEKPLLSELRIRLLTWSTQMD